MSEMTSGLVELAERCERGDGRDTALDLEIYRALWGEDKDMRRSIERGSYSPTGSMDDAMSIVPRWLTPTIIGHDREVKLFNGIGLTVGGDDYCSHAPSLARGLTAAALKAHASNRARAPLPPPPAKDTIV